MKTIKRILAAGLLLTVLSCQPSFETFSSKVYIDAGQKTTKILLDGTLSEVTKTIQSAIPQPEAEPVSVSYSVDESQVGFYNLAFYGDAQMLPRDNWSFDTMSATIQVGSVKSSEANVTFSGLDKLDNEITYVLPVSIASSSVEILTSARTMYYVFQGAALINVVTNMKENYFKLNLTNPGVLNGITTLTAEVLLKPDDFKTDEAGISSVFGIEGQFLIRIGDAGIPNTQVQLATNNGNVTDAAWSLAIGKWQHLAFTFDSATGAADIYIDGVHKGSTQTSNYRNPVNWGVEDFHIGKSYNNNRWFDGDFAEIRIWNRILSSEEINAKNHFYLVDPESEGLVGYWKANEGVGAVWTDKTGNNDAKAANTVVWHSVSLPE